MSDAESAHRYNRALWRLALAGGLLLASWVLATILSATASADELPRDARNGGPSSGEIGTTPGAAKAEARQTSKEGTSKEGTSKEGKPKTPEPGTFVPRGPAISAPDKAPARGAAPAQRWLSTPSQAAPAATPPSKPVVTEKTTTGQPAGDAKPLGALLGSLSTTVNTVTSTVGGLVDTVSNTVLQPVTGGNADGAPGARPLPIIGGLLPGLGLPDGGNSPSGGTVTITVPATLPAEATTPAGSQPGAPQPALPASGAPAAVNRLPTEFTTAGLLAAYRHSAVDQPARSDKHLGSPPGDGSSGGGNVPVTPSAPSAPASITAGHDGSAGARQQHAVLGSSATATQLRLVGTSLDHEVDGAGRDATLPMTSPD